MHKLIYIIFAILRDKNPFELRMLKEHTRILETKHIAT